MAPYTPNIARPMFMPAMRTVTAITNGFPALVTTAIDHGYQTGLIVRLIVPRPFGMTQANGLYGYIEVMSATTFTITIDTTDFDPFSVPDFPIPGEESKALTNAQAVPMAEENASLAQAVRNVLPWLGN